MFGLLTDEALPTTGSGCVKREEFGGEVASRIGTDVEVSRCLRLGPVLPGWLWALGDGGAGGLDTDEVDLDTGGGGRLPWGFLG